MNKTFNAQSPGLESEQQADQVGGLTPNPGPPFNQGEDSPPDGQYNSSTEDNRQQYLPSITPNENKHVSFTYRGPRSYNSKVHGLTNSSFTLGGTLYKFKRRSVHQESPQAHLNQH